MIEIKKLRPIELWNLKTNKTRETNWKVSNLEWPSIFFPRNLNAVVDPINPDVGINVSPTPPSVASSAFCCKNVRFLHSSDSIKTLKCQVSKFKSCGNPGPGLT